MCLGWCDELYDIEVCGSATMSRPMCFYTMFLLSSIPRFEMSLIERIPDAAFFDGIRF